MFLCIPGVDVLEVCGEIDDTVVKVIEKAFQFDLFQSILPNIKPDLGCDSNAKKSCDIFAGKFGILFRNYFEVCGFKIKIIDPLLVFVNYHFKT